MANYVCMCVEVIMLCKIWYWGIIRPYFFENESVRTITITPELYGHMSINLLRSYNWFYGVLNYTTDISTKAVWNGFRTTSIKPLSLFWWVHYENHTIKSHWIFVCGQRPYHLRIEDPNKLSSKCHPNLWNKSFKEIIVLCVCVLF